MPAVKILARNWKLEVQDPVGLLWYQVNGLTSLSFDGEKNDADTTTFDNNGWNTHLVASRNKTISVEGYYLEDQVTKARDDGQYYVETINDLIGSSSVGSFRLTSPAGAVRNFNASVNVTSTGGGNDDPTGWSCELTVSGQPDMGVAVSAGLSALTFVQADGTTALTAYAITPTFANGVFNYTATFTTQTSFKVKPTAASHTILLYVNGAYQEAITSGSANATAISSAAVGANRIDLVVYENGKTRKTYTIMVARTA